MCFLEWFLAFISGGGASVLSERIKNVAFVVDEELVSKPGGAEMICRVG